MQVRKRIKREFNNKHNPPAGIVFADIQEGEVCGVWAVYLVGAGAGNLTRPGDAEVLADCVKEIAYEVLTIS